MPVRVYQHGHGEQVPTQSAMRRSLKQFQVAVYPSLCGILLHDAADNVLPPLLVPGAGCFLVLPPGGLEASHFLV